ncbi:Eco57I restriction-modification methylase domain-containing protein [Natronorubrum thiooxidans]|uniref:site-specific DNA-methyltransferase (adenine-specific) n=1 Tax=Natronorubrum thiooxidans TaxID=308853 RepID=A0A1N7H0F1_9EURY|nr:DNA methyltransferase [Natronorubrum thiooxidans]SIS18337.1 Eco57I restriction-modification methylase [Natronorubrum thiooxidans]
MAQSARGDRGFAAEFADRVFDLKILDPAMGSGHFLTSAIDYLAREIIDAQEKQAAQQGIETVNKEHDINWARRQVAQRCIYGVDLNPLAVELAKVSLWLRTLAAEQPLAFLDHHLKTGNSLVGSDIEEIEELESDTGGSGQNASLADFGVTRKGTIEQLMGIYQDFIAIENQELADVKEMESKYDEFEQNKLRQRLEAMTNVHTAEHFGCDSIPQDAYKRMAASLEDDDSWEDIMDTSWFQTSRKWAEKNQYFHWSLEFPEVFYNEEGGEISDPGFDAIIGNPPYVRVQNLDHDLIDYLKTQYQVAYRRIDVSLMFFELATQLCKISGRASYISSMQFRNSTYGEKLRDYLAERDIEKIVDFGDLPVFEDATTYAGILVWKPSENTDRTVDYTKVNSLSDELVDVLRNETDSDAISRYQTSLLPNEEWTFTNKEEEALINELEENPRLTEFAESCTGMFTGRDEIFLFEPEEAKESDIEDDIFLDVIRGGDPERWHLPQASKKSIYPYQEVDGQTKLLSVTTLQNEYPNAYEYLLSHKEELAERQDSRENIDGNDWYKLTRPGRIPVFNTRKIVTSGESKQNQFCIDEVGSGYSNARVFSVVPENLSAETLLGMLNSKVAEFYLHSISRIKRGGYYSYSCSYLDEVPIPPSIDDRLEELVEVICNKTAELDALNLNLGDYLGNYSEGKNLGELYMPANNLSGTVLTATTDDKDNLRLGDVSVTRENGTVNLYATARYKPVEPDEYETDQWGYTETEPIHAMQFAGLDRKMEQLLVDFVPMAIDKAGGFAGFRETATTTMSLIDRLSALQLPELNDVEDGMSRYIEIHTTAEDLNQEIAELETQIDQLVYDMFDLSEEQIELIESSVNDR